MEIEVIRSHRERMQIEKQRKQVSLRSLPFFALGHCDQLVTTEDASGMNHLIATSQAHACCRNHACLASAAAWPLPQQDPVMALKSGSQFQWQHLSAFLRHRGESLQRLSWMLTLSVPCGSQCPLRHHPTERDREGVGSSWVRAFQHTFLITSLDTSFCFTLISSSLGHCWAKVSDNQRNN